MRVLNPLNPKNANALPAGTGPSDIGAMCVPKLLYSYTDTAAKTLTGFDCGDAQLLLVFVEFLGNDGTVGQAFILMRGFSWQYVTLCSSYNVSSYFDFTDNGVLTQHDQRRYMEYGNFQNKEELASFGVVRRIYKLA